MFLFYFKENKPLIQHEKLTVFVNWAAILIMCLIRSLDELYLKRRLRVGNFHRGDVIRYIRRNLNVIALGNENDGVFVQGIIQE